MAIRESRRHAFEGADKVLIVSASTPGDEALARHRAAIDAASVPFTSLRSGFYTGSALQLMGPALQTGEFVAPEDGPVSWIAHSDPPTSVSDVLSRHITG